VFFGLDTQGIAFPALQAVGIGVGAAEHDQRVRKGCGGSAGEIGWGRLEVRDGGVHGPGQDLPVGQRVVEEDHIVEGPLPGIGGRQLNWTAVGGGHAVFVVDDRAVEDEADAVV